MFNFKIENVTDTLINQASLFNCSLEVAWNEHMHTLITEQFTLDEILNYIEDMQIFEQIEERFRNDNDTRYTLDDVRKMINNRLDK